MNKLHTLGAAIALATGVVSSSFAQTTQTQEVIVLPTKVIETTEVIPDKLSPTPQSEFDARKEAVNSYAQWKIECRGDRACLDQARADYNAAMSRLHMQSSSAGVRHSRKGG